MSDVSTDEESNVLDDVAVTKYKIAADIANKILSELINACVPGSKIIELCQTGDQRIHEECAKYYKKEKSLKKGLAFPTCICVNNIVCHYSPIDGEDNEITEIKDDDLVKIDLGAHIDGFAAVVGHTFVVGASEGRKVTGRKADVIQAALTASEVAMRMLRPNNENVKFSEYILKSAMEFNCRPVEGTQSHQMRRMVYDAEKFIMLNPSEEQRKSVEKCTFDINDVWNIDISISSGSGKAREHKARATVFKKMETLYQLKLKCSRQLHTEITSKFLAYPFNIRALDDLKKARLGITECSRHVLQTLPVLCEKDDEFVAQFRFTVLMMPNGPMRITGLPVDTSIYKSEFKVRDPELKELLLQPIKMQTKKKKPAKVDVQNVGDKVVS